MLTVAQSAAVCRDSLTELLPRLSTVVSEQNLNTILKVGLCSFAGSWTNLCPFLKGDGAAQIVEREKERENTGVFGFE